MNAANRIFEWFTPCDPAGRELQRDQLLMVVRSGHRMLPSVSIISVGIAIVAAIWQPILPVILWFAAMAAVLWFQHTTNVSCLTRAGNIETYPRNAARVFGASALTIAGLCIGAIIIWEPGDPTNHLFVLLLLICSPAIHTVYSAPFPPVTYLGGVHVVTAAALCISEWSATYALFALMAVCVGAMLAGIASSIYEGAREILMLRYSERGLVAQLREASRAKSEFLANMSHELRTPLNAVLGFSDVMRQEMLGPIGTMAYKGYAEDIHASGSHLLTLINQVLDLSKIEAGRYDLRESDVALDQVIEDAIRMIAKRAEDGGVTIINEVPGDMVIRADATALRQVALNVAMNAVKFTPAGGTVRAYGTILADGGLAIAVSDTGCGIQPDDLEGVFENFGQGRHDVTVREKGTGLGLPIVRSLMRAHGGDATIVSTLGRGTTVYLTLPRQRVISLGALDLALLPETRAA